MVGPNYLETMRTPLLAGRDFTDAGHRGYRSLWSSSTRRWSDRYWPGQNAIGKRVYDGRRSTTVVGVTANGKYRRLIYDPTSAGPVCL